MKNFLFGLIAFIVPTIIYEISAEILVSLGISDAPTLKVAFSIIYALLAFSLVILIYENINTDKNKLILVLMDLLTGGIIFLLAYFSWVPIFYTIIALIFLMYWHDRSKTKGA